MCFYNAGNVYSLFTDSDYRYTYSWLLPVENYLTFKVRTCNDAHLLLSSSRDLNGPTYEIVLGGYDNQWSDIRRGPQGEALAQAYTPNIMSCDELLPVWVQWQSQTIEVGVGPFRAHTILRHDDPDLLPIQSAAITSWYTASGEYRFLETQGEDCIY